MSYKKTEKNQKLTDRQERFCKEYVVSMNATQAYKSAYNFSNMLPETIHRRAFHVKNVSKVQARIKELKNDIEETLGISKAQIVEKLRKLAARSEYVEEHPQSFKFHENAIKAYQQISKMIGYDDNKLDITSGGDKLKSSIIVVRPKIEEDTIEEDTD